MAGVCLRCYWKNGENRSLEETIEGEKDKEGGGFRDAHWGGVWLDTENHN